ncbi:hypothetical protein MMC24_006854 [Lignoscripta atroalba]|nr:hypothetical protein [Lignoscripta atroalba]
MESSNPAANTEFTQGGFKDSSDNNDFKPVPSNDPGFSQSGVQQSGSQQRGYQPPSSQSITVPAGLYTSLKQALADATAALNRANDLIQQLEFTPVRNEDPGFSRAEPEVGGFSQGGFQPSEQPFSQGGFQPAERGEEHGFSQGGFRPIDS